MWSTGTLRSCLSISFKLLRDGPNSGGSSEHPIVSTTDLCDIDIVHPFVDCFLDGVLARALLDTGFMKSFISHNVQAILDFNDSLLDKTSAQQCVSITGDNLNILGQLNTVVKFSNSKVTYASDFLVSDNIQYECVLGWDFINRHKLSFHTGPGKGYFLVGKPLYGIKSLRRQILLGSLTVVCLVLRLIVCCVSQRFKAMQLLFCLRVQ